MFTKKIAKNFWQKVISREFLVLLTIAVLASHVFFWSICYNGNVPARMGDTLLVFVLCNLVAAIIAAASYCIRDCQAGLEAWSSKWIKIAAVFEIALCFFCLYLFWTYPPPRTLDLIVMSALILWILAIPVLITLWFATAMNMYSEYSKRKRIKLYGSPQLYNT